MYMHIHNIITVQSRVRTDAHMYIVYIFLLQQAERKKVHAKVVQLKITKENSITSLKSPCLEDMTISISMIAYIYTPATILSLLLFNWNTPLPCDQSFQRS